MKDPRGQSLSFRQALLTEYIVNRANRKLMSGLAQRMPAGRAANRLDGDLDNSEVLCEYIDTRDYVDILMEFDEASFESPEAFVAQLTPVAPRLYSIASSPLAHPGEVHLCIAVVRYDTQAGPRRGSLRGSWPTTRTCL